ncbi:desulfoferrodoxin [Patescibacteria group bacterium]|nr:desulfoferrodoxin [Patescibacteria group bacterium]
MISENNYEEAQTYQDPYNPSELEQKHVPILEPNTVSVKVTVGEVKHVMEANHWIQYIELFADGESVGRIDLQPGEEPEAEFEVDVPKTKKLSAQALCNQHGLWENEINLKSNNAKS